MSLMGKAANCSSEEDAGSWNANLDSAELLSMDADVARLMGSTRFESAGDVRTRGVGDARDHAAE
jgi:hypothetical protein